MIKKKGKMKRVQLRITDEQDLYMKQLARQHEASICEVYRDIIDYHRSNQIQKNENIV